MIVIKDILEIFIKSSAGRFHQKMAMGGVWHKTTHVKAKRMLMKVSNMLSVDIEAFFNLIVSSLPFASSSSINGASAVALGAWFVFGTREVFDPDLEGPSVGELVSRFGGVATSGPFPLPLFSTRMSFQPRSGNPA